MQNRSVNSPTTKEQPILLRHSKSVVAVAFSPDGRRVATGSSDNAIIWNASNGEILHTLSGHSAAVCGVSWSPSGELLITGSDDGKALIWQSNNGALLNTVNAHSSGLLGGMYGVAWSPTDELVATAGTGTSKIWNPKTGQLLQTTQVQPGSFHAIAFSPDGRSILIGSSDTTAKIFAVTASSWTRRWMRTEPELLRTLRGHSKIVNTVAWSPSGDLIATGSSDRTVRLWKSSSSDALRTLVGHSDAVWGVAWSPSGDFVISGSRDQTAIFWNAATGDALQTLTHHSHRVRAVAWSSRGDRIATASWDTTAQILSVFVPTLQGNRMVENATDESKPPSNRPRENTPNNGNDHSNPSPNPPNYAILDAALHTLGLSQSANPHRSNPSPNPPNYAVLDTALHTALHTLGLWQSANPYSNPPRENTPNSRSGPTNPRRKAFFDAALHSSKEPQSRCFKDSKELRFEDALTKLLQLRDRPMNRSDLKIPNDSDIKEMLSKVEDRYKDVQSRSNARKLIQDQGLTVDEVKAIICYTMDGPYEVFRWLNAWLMSNRLTPRVKNHVGPFFILFYRGIEKLPRSKVRASRGVPVRHSAALRKTFKEYQKRCEKGSSLSFWGVASFTKKDEVAEFFADENEDGDDDAIVYTCGDLECVSIRDLSNGPEEEEVLPLPPVKFVVNSAAKVGKKLVIAMDQKDHHEIAYVEPK